MSSPITVPAHFASARPRPWYGSLHTTLFPALGSLTILLILLPQHILPPSADCSTPSRLPESSLPNALVHPGNRSIVFSSSASFTTCWRVCLLSSSCWDPQSLARGLAQQEHQSAGKKEERGKGQDPKKEAINTPDLWMRQTGL